MKRTIMLGMIVTILLLFGFLLVSCEKPCNCDLGNGAVTNNPANFCNHSNCAYNIASQNWINGGSQNPRPIAPCDCK